MAAVAPPANQATELLQKLSLETQPKTIEVPEAPQKPSIDSNNMANGIQSDRSITPVLPHSMDPTMCYVPSGYASPAYYFTGYDGSANEWEDYNRYVNPDGVDMTSGVYGENGSVMYHHGYSYAPYGPYSPAASPVPTVGHDGQLYGGQHYQYPTPYFQSLTPTGGPLPTLAAPAKGEIASAAAIDQAPLSLDSINSKSNVIANSGGAKGNNGSVPARTTYQNSSFNGSYGRGPASVYLDPTRYGSDGLQSPYPWFEPYFSDGQTRPVTTSSMMSSIAKGVRHPQPMSGVSSANRYINRMYPNKLYGQYGNVYRSGFGYGSSAYDTRANGRGWMAVDGKYKPRGRGNGFYSYGNESMDGLNELNRGPRSKSSKNLKGFIPVALAVKGQSIPLTGTTDNEEKVSSATPDKEQYNQPEFPETYSDAKFFIIKSYSEDDVHKSIKYNIWSSTPNGNKKLYAEYVDAQQKSGGCPVFLFFSVNTSGQFVGMAEMSGPVDFNKNVEYWQQDKWIGCFPVKWHIVKDVPNSLLKHIILENNENKPVTNSRDTQEVKLEQGLQLIKIFKDYTSKQCILDDFEFYEDRQRRIQEKKLKQQQFQKQAQVWEGTRTEEKKTKDTTNGDLKPLDTASDLNEVAHVLSNGESKTSESESSPVSRSGDARTTANGAANGC
ncbi:evolutionarily conserved C-terminal region 2 [Salvia divinorum]|uniref:YTH domain-containing family protein n=1 Tax=Salvia divinorum TaxID=28513 RepID=A0ABD1IBC2_SALDI